MHRLKWILWLGMAACAGPESLACEATCDTLVTECAFAAFPSLDSCVDGCLYAAANEAAVDELSTCSYEAACDTFAVMECARLTEGS